MDNRQAAAVAADIENQLVQWRRGIAPGSMLLQVRNWQSQIGVPSQKAANAAREGESASQYLQLALRSAQGSADVKKAAQGALKWISEALRDKTLQPDTTSKLKTAEDLLHSAVEHGSGNALEQAISTIGQARVSLLSPQHTKAMKAAAIETLLNQANQLYGALGHPDAVTMARKLQRSVQSAMSGATTEQRSWLESADEALARLQRQPVPNNVRDVINALTSAAKAPSSGKSAKAGGSPGFSTSQMVETYLNNIASLEKEINAVGQEGAYNASREAGYVLQQAKYLKDRNLVSISTAIQGKVQQYEPRSGQQFLPEAKTQINSLITTAKRRAQQLSSGNSGKSAKAADSGTNWNTAFMNLTDSIRTGKMSAQQLAIYIEGMIPNLQQDNPVAAAKLKQAASVFQNISSLPRNAQSHGLTNAVNYVNQARAALSGGKSAKAADSDQWRTMAQRLNSTLRGLPKGMAAGWLKQWGESVRQAAQQIDGEMTKRTALAIADQCDRLAKSGTITPAEINDLVQRTNAVAKHIDFNKPIGKKAQSDDITDDLPPPMKALDAARLLLGYAADTIAGTNQSSVGVRVKAFTAPDVVAVLEQAAAALREVEDVKAVKALDFAGVRYADD